MPRKTKAEYEAELASWAALNDLADWSDEEGLDGTIDSDGEALELLALEQLGIVQCLSGMEIPKSGLLSNPERRFRQEFEAHKVHVLVPDVPIQFSRLHLTLRI
jgi:hypothetical protein